MMKNLKQSEIAQRLETMPGVVRTQCYGIFKEDGIRVWFEDGHVILLKRTDSFYQDPVVMEASRREEEASQLLMVG